MSQPTASSPQHSQSMDTSHRQKGERHRAELLIPEWQCNAHPIFAQPLQHMGFTTETGLCEARWAKTQGCRGQLVSWGGWTPIRLLYPRTPRNAGSQLSSDGDEIRDTLTVQDKGLEAFLSTAWAPGQSSQPQVRLPIPPAMPGFPPTAVPGQDLGGYCCSTPPSPCTHALEGAGCPSTRSAVHPDSSVGWVVQLLPSGSPKTQQVKRGPFQKDPAL